MGHLEGRVTAYPRNVSPASHSFPTTKIRAHLSRRSQAKADLQPSCNPGHRHQRFFPQPHRDLHFLRIPPSSVPPALPRFTGAVATPASPPALPSPADFPDALPPRCLQTVAGRHHHGKWVHADRPDSSRGKSLHDIPL